MFYESFETKNAMVEFIFKLVLKKDRGAPLAESRDSRLVLDVIGGRALIARSGHLIGGWASVLGHVGDT